MIIKIFKISTMEMWILHNKNALIDFIEQEMDLLAPKNLTINELIKWLPVENYYRMK